MVGLLALSSSEFFSFDWLRTNGKWQLVVVLSAYLLGVLLTNQLFVTYPAVRKVVRQLDEERTLIQRCWRRAGGGSGGWGGGGGGAGAEGGRPSSPGSGGPAAT